MQLIDHSSHLSYYLIISKIENKLFVFALKLNDIITIPVFKDENKAVEFCKELEKSSDNRIFFDLFQIQESLLSTFYDYLIFYNNIVEPVKLLEIEDSDFFFYNEENSKNFIMIEVDN
ncbi:MAG: hypothetical protein ABIL47_08505 [candidate division WOR-3 bacterium]